MAKLQYSRIIDGSVHCPSQSPNRLILHHLHPSWKIKLEEVLAKVFTGRLTVHILLVYMQGWIYQNSNEGLQYDRSRIFVFGCELCYIGLAQLVSTRSVSLRSLDSQSAMFYYIAIIKVGSLVMRNGCLFHQTNADYFF